MNSNNMFVKIMSMFVVFAMMFSALCISPVASVEAEQTITPIDVEIEEAVQPVLEVTKLVANTPVIYLGQKNQLTVSIVNVGEVQALKTTAKIFDIIPEQGEELITTLNLGALRPGMEKSRFVEWMPSLSGIHYIKAELNCTYLTHNSPAEMVESSPTIMSVGFPVAPLSNPEYWGPNEDIKSVINLENDPSGFRYRDGPLTIIVREGDLEVWSDTTLQLNDDVILVIENPYAPGEFGVDIKEGGQFVINSPSRTTTVTKSSSTPTDYTYTFHNYGVVDFSGASVMYTYGDRTDLALAGGIVNHQGSACTLADCWLSDADTHTICNVDSELTVAGEYTFLGKGNPAAVTNKGSGIVISGDAVSTIDGVIIYDNDGNNDHFQVSANPLWMNPCDGRGYYMIGRFSSITSDSNGDGLISVWESWTYALDNNHDYDYLQPTTFLTPLYYECELNLGSTTYL